MLHLGRKINIFFERIIKAELSHYGYTNAFFCIACGIWKLTWMLISGTNESTSNLQNNVEDAYVNWMWQLGLKLKVKYIKFDFTIHEARCYKTCWSWNYYFDLVKRSIKMRFLRNLNFRNQNLLFNYISHKHRLGQTHRHKLIKTKTHTHLQTHTDTHMHACRIKRYQYQSRKMKAYWLNQGKTYPSNP